MKSEEFISSLSALSGEDEKFERIRKDIPLGVDSVGNIAYARRTTGRKGNHLCVTGGGKSKFIRRLLITISCLYERSEACFFVLSANDEYGELLRMRSMDVTLPYTRVQSDLRLALDTLKELVNMRAYGRGYPRLFVVLDDLENIDGCNRNEDLEEYREILELLSRREDVDVISGVELTKSIFKGYPGAFVGVGNCLVSASEGGKADVTYVEEDASLSLPSPITYPSEPSIAETVTFFNLVAEQKV